jgi:ketosteroid isomerase-like protein
VVEPEEGTKVETQGRSAEVARRQPDGSWRFVIDAPTFAL